MIRTTLRQLWERKFRLLTTGTAILLGVAFMAGTLILTDTLERSFAALFADANAGTDAYIRSAQVTANGERGRIDASIVDTVRDVAGVDAAYGTVEGFAMVAGGAPAIGRNWIPDDRLNGFDVVDGRAPVADDEIVVDRATLVARHLSVGDAVEVLTQDGTHGFRLVGAVTFGDADSAAGTGTVLFTGAAAEAHLAVPGTVDGVVVAGAEGRSQREVAEAIDARLPRQFDVLTGAQRSAEDRSEIQKSLSFFSTFLVVFALISLFVGSFIIFNTFSILVAQRSRQSALLRALGASRRQVLGSVVLEAGVIGTVSSAAGLVVGMGVAAGLRGVMAAMGIDLPDVPLTVSQQTVVVSLATGLGVTLAASVLPARRAARVAPVAAMRGAAAEDTTTSRGRLAGGLAVVAGGGIAMAIGLFGDGGVPAVGAGAAVTFLGVALLGPAIARPLTKVLGAPLPALRGVPGTLGRENAMRNPKRTSTTAAALMIGVALVGFITIVAASTKSSIRDAIATEFTGDLVVGPDGMHAGGFDAAVLDELRRLPEVERAIGVRTGRATVGGADVEVSAGDAAAVAGIFDLGTVQGSFDRLGADGVAISKAEATHRGIAVGDTIRMEFADAGARTLRVAAVYEKDDFVGSWLLETRGYEASYRNRLLERVFLVKAGHTTDEALLAAVTSVVDGHPGLVAQDQRAFTGAETEGVDQMLNVVYALLALAVLIALMGITNTLALSIVERTRELGLLRAVGMSRSQLRSMIRWEAIVVALLGTTLGLGIGVGFAWAVVRALRTEGITAFTVPVAQLIVITVLAALAGVVAAVLPARRAARMDVLVAVAA
jgi:putative ABC transport system permease protein